MRIGVAQINPVLGDFQSNADKILDYVKRARDRKCDLVVFPESCLFGYHPFDLLERTDVVAHQEKVMKDIFRRLPKGIAVIFGIFTKNPSKKGRLYFNSAVLVEKGVKPRFFHKQLLPTGDVFDEARFIEAGDMRKNVFRLKGKKFFLTICEDIWAWPNDKKESIYEENPLSKVKEKGVDFVVNLSASPFYPGKDKIRQELVKKTARHFKAPMLYCNLVGAQDEIIFDGRSFILDPQGRILMRCLAFEEDLGFFDLETQEGSPRPHEDTGIAEIHRALVMGLRDYCEKTGFKKIHLGLSGGIDSAVVAALAVDALGPNNVKAFYLPSQFSSPKSGEAAKALAMNLGIQFQEIPLQSAYELVKSLIDREFDISKFGLVHENLQARLRGLILMAFSNFSNSLLLATGNKSELAAGYSTLYGDLCGGLLPIGDLTKGQVVALAQYYNRERELIPKFIIDRPPSAELRPDQKDEDSLPAYTKLDESVVRLVENSGKIRNETDEWLMGALSRSEFKRWQAPPILKVSKHSFGRGRRWPVAHRTRF